MSQRCGWSCWVKTAWNEPHQAFSPDARQEHSPATEEEMKVLAERMYAPIRDWQTRVLKILPNSSSDALIECELLVATLGDKSGVGLDQTGQWIQYDALSYAWGRPDFTVSIKCNSLMFPTTRNLAEALHFLRHADHERYLWTDAICINQFDLEEKGRQVQAMYKIFKHAESVRGWLGPSTASNYQLFSFLTTVHKRRSGSEVSTIRRPESFAREHDEACTELLGSLRNAMMDLVSTNQWFSRTWIRQEVAAAQNVKMFGGSYHFPLDVLVNIALAFDGVTLSDHGVRRQKDVPRMFYPRTFLALLPRKRPLTWSEAFFTNAEGFQASLDQDRVYALQNMVEGDVEAKHRLFSVISYQKTPVQIYEEFVKKLLSCHSFSMLNVFEDYRERPSSADLPSWIPDPRINQIRFVAHSHERSPWRSYTPALGGSGVLMMRGFKLGTIGYRKPLPEWEKKDEWLTLYYDFKAYGKDVALDRSSIHDDLHIQTGREFYRALQQVSYSYYNVDIFAHNLKCGNPSKHREGLLATSAGEPGDIVVQFHQSREHYLLHQLKGGGVPRYRFLGPAVFTAPVRYPRMEWPPKEVSSKSSSLIASVKKKVHHHCELVESQMKYEDFVML